jgi:glyceraldehyde-3-phosphate dehydrogenase (NAD(P))
MIRRGADPWDIRHGPINSVVPVLELPSHHGPDVRTVLKDVEIFTTAMSVPTTLMHMHSVIVDCKKKPDVDEVIEMFKKTTRVRVVDNKSRVRSTAEIMEFAKDLSRNARGDMHEIVLWKEGVGSYENKLLYMQAVHQESDVVPENIDAIRCAIGKVDAETSMNMTNESLNVNYCKNSF